MQTPSVKVSNEGNSLVKDNNVAPRLILGSLSALHSDFQTIFGLYAKLPSGSKALSVFDLTEA